MMSAASIPLSCSSSGSGPISESQSAFCSSTPAATGSEDDEVIFRLIPFAFDNLSASTVAKVRGKMHKIDKAIDCHSDPKDRSKELRVIANKLGFELNRKSEEFLFIEAVAIIKLTMKPEGERLVFDMSSFLHEFPEFSGLSGAEKNKLLAYRNMMKVAIQVIPAKWNYNHLLALVAHIAEGGKVKYVTGSGATDQTKYRMIIYEKISGIPRQKRAEKTYAPLMGMLCSGILASDDNSSDNSASVRTDSVHSAADLPVREKSYFVHSARNQGLLVTTKEMESLNGTVMRSSSSCLVPPLDSTDQPPAGKEVCRSVSVSSTCTEEIDTIPLFENFHGGTDFDFFGDTGMESVKISHQSIYSDDGNVFHDVVVTEQLDDEAFGIIGDEFAPFPLRDENVNVSGMVTRKRKMSSASSGAAEMPCLKKISPNQTERYDVLVKKLSDFIFEREGVGATAIPGKETLSNHEFITKVLKPHLSNLEDLISTKQNAKLVTKSMKKFASSIGVEPLSRFNDHFLIVECALVLLLSSRLERQDLKVNFQQFLSENPEFLSMDSQEQELLFTYRNMLAAALEVIPGKWNSNHLLDIVTRIVEGKDKKYVTGSGATKQTRNRIDIYHRLTGIEKKSKPITFLNSVFQYLSDSNGNSSASSSDERASEAEERAAFGESSTSSSSVITQFKNIVIPAERVLEMDVRKDDYCLPAMPEVKVSTTEVYDESTSCRQTSVFKEVKDAVTGVSFRVELARGVSITNTASDNSFELFEDLDLYHKSTSADGNDLDRYRSEFDQCIAMLQDHGQTGIHLNRDTSGSSSGIIRSLSLTRHLTEEIPLDDAQGFRTDLMSIVRAPSRGHSFRLLSPTRDSSLLKLI